MGDDKSLAVKHKTKAHVADFNSAYKVVQIVHSDNAYKHSYQSSVGVAGGLDEHHADLAGGFCDCRVVDHLLFAGYDSLVVAALAVVSAFAGIVVGISVRGYEQNILEAVRPAARGGCQPFADFFL